MTVAFAVSSHGFGHAARASAVIEALLEAAPRLRIDVFTAVPDWFFHDNLRPDHRVDVHTLDVDVGLVQRDTLTVDLPASVARLRSFIRDAPQLTAELAERLRHIDADLVVADIAPVALLAARRAAIDSVLVESFTWDFIYRGYTGADPAFAALAETFGEWAASATLRIQTEPWCQAARGALTVAPVSRPPRRSRDAVRAALEIATEAPIALVTMGGIPWHHEPPADHGDAPFWLLASDVPTFRRQGRAILLPRRSGLYHPDLVAAADVVVAKLGYSTLAETAATGRALAYVPRPDFPESPILEHWAQTHLETERIAPEAFVAGCWHRDVMRLLNRESGSLGGQAQTASRATADNGAQQIAAEILRRLPSQDLRRHDRGAFPEVL